MDHAVIAVVSPLSQALAVFSKITPLASSIHPSANVGVHPIVTADPGGIDAARVTWG